MKDFLFQIQNLLQDFSSNLDKARGKIIIIKKKFKVVISLKKSKSIILSFLSLITTNSKSYFISLSLKSSTISYCLILIQKTARFLRENDVKPNRSIRQNY
ncbi:hypothetical protein TTHERM_000647418 (macronuclear) [Tetrahymena thermophila SB210]|uniref:Uncharacterized protein n=1 Tax=Tetrahymena thermophila (strain SB210) TaxID=312017 RepID=W7XE13_TETTS|nr:hypothetical protein TTHERM_000647418 [Tetrahymena thermophila SB210]EWS71094.1 hypothetical protein TTHERM_000647418 [Tetrahymena thermophila SB210]|eukprot:XP_012656393.1 hypothetical protein TTHERM_000647418 [Tetrahymena thermophila SB210]